jgi:MerR family transcriptional regulator, copper efflux regulator
VTVSSQAASKLLRIGDLARLTGKSVRAIHLYEELGLLRPASRTSGGFRLYEATAVERMRWIELFHGMGFSLHEMRELVHAWWDAGLGPEAMDRLRSIFERKLEDTREAIRRSQQLEKELAAGLDYLKACRVCASPASTAAACVGCSQDHGMTREPALVAGLKTTSPARGARRRAPLVRVDQIA